MLSQTTDDVNWLLLLAIEDSLVRTAISLQDTFSENCVVFSSKHSANFNNLVQLRDRCAMFIVLLLSVIGASWGGS
jgi:hypothetical protein